MSRIIVYVTAPSQREAKKIASVLLREKLIACANIVASSSLYRWKGKTVRSKEAVIFMKSVKKHWGRIGRTVRKLSSYECPCIVCIDIAGESKEYLRWLRSAVL